MEKLINLYKPLGLTPLAALNRFREKHPQYKDLKMVYAGRLDPMAEGVLLVLAGQERYKWKNYLDLDKEYEAQILFGFETDTFDILGLVMKSKSGSSIEKTKIINAIQKFSGKLIMRPPPFSSYRIKGKPLFYWTLTNQLNKVVIPERTVLVSSIKLVKLKQVSIKDLQTVILSRLACAQGPFRQEIIKTRWLEAFASLSSNASFTVAQVKLSCSSGTYVRVIAQQLGVKLKTGALLLHLKRTRVDGFDIKNSVRV